MDIFYYWLLYCMGRNHKFESWNTICRLQKRTARIILNAKYDIPSLQLFKKLGWLSIQNRLEYHKSALMYKCINNSAPDYLCNLFDMNTNSNVYSLRNLPHSTNYANRIRTMWTICICFEASKAIEQNYNGRGQRLSGLEHYCTFTET
jgi:hypothetical protein